MSTRTASAAIPPLLIRNILHPNCYPYPLLLVAGDSVHVPVPALQALIGDFVDDAQGGLIAAAMGETGFGYIDGHGRWIVAPTLQEVRSFADDGLARFKAGGLWGYLDRQGVTVIAPRFADAGAFVHGLAPVLTDGGWRYIDHSGAFAFDAVFADAGDFSRVGLAPVSEQALGPFGFIDVRGAWAIAPRFRYAPDFWEREVAPATLDGQRYGVIDRRGEWLVPPRYDRIDNYDATGYAACMVDEPGEYPAIGYLDTAGREAIPPQAYLSRIMEDGLVRRDDCDYVGLDGPLHTSVELVWGADFNGHGFALARARERKREPFPGDADGREEPWGILRADGQFACAPAGVLEPLTDPNGWLIAPEPGTPLAPFVTAEDDVALLDRNGQVAYRLGRDPVAGGTTIVLRDGGGRTLWRSAPFEWAYRVGRFFDPEPEAFLEDLEDYADIAGRAEALLAQTREKLALLAAGEWEEEDTGEDEEDDQEGWPGDDASYNSWDDVQLSEDEEESGWDSPAARSRTAQRVFRAYIDEGNWGRYHFMSYSYTMAMRRAHGELLKRLTERFGPPTATAADTGTRWDETPTGWVFGEEPRRLWLDLRPVEESGDGTFWCHLWLRCAPTPATLAAACTEFEDEGDA